MTIGLRWARRRQLGLTRVVLALFCAAWLQAAIVPCVTAHAAGVAPQSQAPTHHGHDASAAHPHGAAHAHGMVRAGQHADHGARPCLYCPPAESGVASCDGHRGCAFPHDPQVDARAAGVLWAAMPVSFVTPLPAALVAADRPDIAVADVTPRVSLSVSYCRFIE